MEDGAKIPEYTGKDTPIKKSMAGNLFAVFRFTLFLAVFLGTLISFIPEGFGSMVDTRAFLPLFVIGTVIILFLIGMAVFLFRSPRTNPSSSLFDFEPIAAVVIGVLGLIAIGIAGILEDAERPDPAMIFASFLAIFYLFYVYRLIQVALRAKQEIDAIRTQYGELLEVERQKANFILITSHQFRTPLTEIRWALESILTKVANLSSDAISMLERSKKSVETMTAIVNTMLRSYARGETLQAGRGEEINVEALITDILDEIALLAKEKAVAIEFIPPPQKILFSGDRQKIKIALVGIIDNAIRYSPKGRVTITLDVETRVFHIRIKDTGAGISPEDQNKIFTRFFRGGNAQLIQPDGSGISLFGAKQMIESHGGTISFFSEIAKGTTFIITLPLAS